MTFNRPMDPFYPSVVSTNIMHTRIHLGHAFHAACSGPVLKGQTAAWLLRTHHDHTVHLHYLRATVDTAPAVLSLWENAEIADMGQTVQAYNLNRQEPDQSPGLEVWKMPAIAAYGTKLMNSRLEETVTGGARLNSSDIPHEWVLRRNTDYVMSLENLSGKDVVASLEICWYDSSKKDFRRE